MRCIPQRQADAFRSALTAAEVLLVIAFLVLLVLLNVIFRPSLGPRELPRRALCASNLRGIGQGLHIYANDNNGWFPHHYYEPTKAGDDLASDHAVRWVGTMGSTRFLSITEETSPTVSPTASHPSRSLFLLVTSGMATPAQFICPHSDDEEDDLRNYGPDAPGSIKSAAARPGRTRFDFRGYDFLSYAYQLPYGHTGKPHELMESQMPIAADKGPYYTAGGEGVPGTKTVRDQRALVNVPRQWAALPAVTIQNKAESAWQPYNSPNHRGEGQNVLYVDGHASFERTPLTGINADNIYTLQTGYDAIAALIGRVPEPRETTGPLTETDSFLVP
jgi:prepilin-type processing-associated H-X9-DG protein